MSVEQYKIDNIHRIAKTMHPIPMALLCFDSHLLNDLIQSMTMGTKSFIFRYDKTAI